MYDFIIIGGGSAGCLLANRLSAIHTVLLIEAGSCPSKYSKNTLDGDNVGRIDPYDWNYSSFQPQLDRNIQIDRAKILGGCSVINAGAYIKGMSYDYDSLHIDTKSINKHFNNIESNINGHMHLITNSASKLSKICKTFLRVMMMNGYSSDVGMYQVNIIKGIRINTALAFLNSEVRNRSTLDIICNEEVKQLLFNGTTAVGVLTYSGNIFRCSKEIILSAGTYGSAYVLHRSGIGPKRVLDNLGIPVLVEHNVGTTLYEHPFYTAKFRLRKEYRNNTEYTQSKFVGPEVLLWTSIDDEKNRKNIQIFPMVDSKYLMFGICLTIPSSKGSTRITTDPKKPYIDIGLLKDENDILKLVSATEILINIIKESSMQKYIKPIQTYTHADLVTDIKNNTECFGHSMGTIPITDVLDKHYNVKNIYGLKVADASVFKHAISTPIHASVLLVAEIVSEIILKKYK